LHPAVAFVGGAQDLLHFPQFVVLVFKLVSQPSALLELQSP
jgi:hypothetical protein